MKLRSKGFYSALAISCAVDLCGPGGLGGIAIAQTANQMQDSELLQNGTPMPALRGLDSSQGAPAIDTTHLQSQAALREGSGVGTSAAASMSAGVGASAGNGMTADGKQYASVESYFMLGPNRDTRGAKMQPATIDYSMRSGMTAESAGRKHGFLWHLMDNIGVPMPGLNNLEIDPSIKSVSLIAPPKLPSERTLTKELKVVNQNLGGSTPASASPPEATPGTQPAQQKIPESELEGTIYETPASKETPAPTK